MSSYGHENLDQILSTKVARKDDDDNKNIDIFPWKSGESKKPSILRSKDKTTNFVEFSLSRLNLSSRRRKPIIRKSKLKFIGNQMFIKKQCITQKEPLPSIDDTVDASSRIHGPSCLTERYKICLCDTNYITKSIRPLNFRNIFEKGKDVVPLQDFKSLSLKEKWINPDNENETVGNFDFVSNCTFRNSKQSLKHKSVKKGLRDSELPDLKSLSLSENKQNSNIKLSCAKQAIHNEEFSTDELAAYLDNYLHFPKKMSYMAEMMYT